MSDNHDDFNEVWRRPFLDALSGFEDADTQIDTFTTCLRIFPIEIRNRLEGVRGVSGVYFGYSYDRIQFDVKIVYYDEPLSRALSYRDIYFDMAYQDSKNRIRAFYYKLKNDVEWQVARVNI